jgi:hypothetical protein
MHRLAVRANMKVGENTYLKKDLWNRSSFQNDVDSGYIIHIRPKVTQGGPKRPKIENYRQLVKQGILE